MEDLFLVQPTEEYINQIGSYKQEFLDLGSSFDGCGLLRDNEPEEWLKKVEFFSQEETCPKHWVVTTQFICVRRSDRRLVGMIQLRHSLNEYLEQFGGHIGYSVRPSERRKGYAKFMLKECLAYAKNQACLDRVLITCKDSNEASRRTILSQGGVYESTVLDADDGIKLERYWINF